MTIETATLGIGSIFVIFSFASDPITEPPVCAATHP